MLIPLNQILLIYEKMVEQLNVEYISVIIFTSLDIDALCSLKILSKFFKSQSINFKVYPALNYTQLQRNIEQTKVYEKIKLFLFINCGGMIDLSSKWFMNSSQPSQQSQSRQPQSYIFLFDINKPINHNNINHPNVQINSYEKLQIYVVNDDNSKLDKRITNQDILELKQLEQFDLDQVDIQDDDEEGNQSDEQRQKKSRNKSHKRNSQKLIIQKLKKKKQHLQDKVDDYYKYSFFSLPSSYILYRFIRELNKTTNYSLWLAIIGMTSMYLQNNITRDSLQILTAFYRSDMIKFNPQNNEKRQRNQIYTKKDYLFPLLNHWSLYESMMNSSYLMIKLELWKDKGIKTLHEVLTKIGISIAESKQKYKYMLKQSKQALEQNIFKIAEWYKLPDITFLSFMRQSDSSSAHMASDYYYLLLGILQKPLHKSTSLQMSQHRLNSFWQAYSVLQGSQQMIKKGIQEYKQISCIIMREVKDVIERDNIIAMKKINFANIRCDNKQKKIFEHYSTLMRFGYLLMGIQKQIRYLKEKQNQKQSKSIPNGPFIISLLDVEKNISTLAGLVPHYKSKLGTEFSTVVGHLKIQVQHDKFSPNVIVIQKENLTEFIQNVDYLLQGRNLNERK